MAENDAVAAEKKVKAEVLEVTMTDGRKVNFVGKRKVNKETIIDQSKITVDGDTLMLQAGAVSVRMDFRNGETRTLVLPLGGESGIAKFAGHGGEQKFGDELASSADKPMSEDDMVIAIDDLYAEISAGKWGKGRAEGGGGVSGAATVVKAIMEATGKSLDFVKGFLDKRLAATPGLTRRELYASFRAPGTPTAVIIRRMEDEKAAKASKVDAGAALAEMTEG